MKSCADKRENALVFPMFFDAGAQFCQKRAWNPSICLTNSTNRLKMDGCERNSAKNAVFCRPRFYYVGSPANDFQTSWIFFLLRSTWVLRIAGFGGNALFTRFQ